MSIHIVTSRPHLLLQPVMEAVGANHQNNEPVLMLVPEQFTLQAERELIKRLHLECLFNLEVLSPSRLYERVLDHAGRDRREPLSDAGRRMAISQALERLDGKLSYYASIAHRRGFVEKLSSLITDMKRGGLTPEQLAVYADGLEEGVERAKLTDLSQIYEQYRVVLKDRFSDGEDLLAYVADRLEASGCLNGRHMYVYGFDTLPEQLMRLLCAAAPLCASLTIALVMDGESAPDGELFLPVRQGVARFMNMLRQKGMEAELRAYPAESLKRPPAIKHIDACLYTFTPKLLTAQQQNVFLFSGISPFEEAATMTRQVMRLLAEGMDIERIAVLYPDQNGYAFAVSAALRASGLPFYTDEKLPATSHGLTRYLLCALRAMSEGFRNQDVLGMLKSGYAPLDFEECCELENYALTYGINRQRWQKPFTKGSPTLCERCEALRLRLMAPLTRAREALVTARDAAASMSAAFGLMQDIDAYETLKREEERLLANGLIARANQNSQIWRAMLTLMDQMVRLGGDARIPLKYIAGRLECGFAAISLASLPPASHMLHAGALGHMLAEDMDAVFLLGMNDGVLSRDTQSLLTAQERERTQTETGCFLGLTDENRGLLAKLDLKRAMTMPQKALFISSAKTALDGTALRPLSLINTLQKRMFGELPQSPVPEAELPLSASQAISELSLILRAHADNAVGGELTPRWREILLKLVRCPSTAPATMRLMHALGFDGQAQPLSSGQARALFGDQAMSVSRLEQFANCPFMHFINYGLRPHVLREWKVDPIETGSFYHASLDNFSNLARKSAEYPNLPDEAIARMADEAIKPLTEEILNGPMGDGDRGRARFERACAAVRRSAVVITHQLAAGDFALYRTEASFGYEGGFPPIVLTLKNNEEVMLRGRIDRVDRYDTPEATYLRVIDYKSSQQNLDAARVWRGLQLQLLLYLDVCAAAIPNGKPAGAFYFYVADPLVESATDLQAAAEEKLRDIFQLRGVTLTDVEILNAMDSGEVPFVLPPTYQKSGELRKNARALDMTQLKELLKHARKVASELADELFGGSTAIAPMRDGTNVACTYCDYHAVCHFDYNAPDAPFRELPDMDMDTLREELSK